MGLCALREAGVDAIAGAVVQPMAAAGLELLVGTTYDEQFGPLIVVGLGGTQSEALADVVAELAPVSETEAAAMLDRLRGRALLDEFRGVTARDRPALAALVAAVSELAVDAGALLRELDLNPVVAYAAGAGCLVLDGAAVLARA